MGECKQGREQAVNSRNGQALLDRDIDAELQLILIHILRLSTRGL
jgi:hypothetical protein